MRRIETKLMTREKIRQAAEETFVRSNFMASTFKIAREARVAHGTIFFHFKDRNDLVMAVVRRMVLRITDDLYVAYKDSNSLTAFLSVHFDTLRSNWPTFKALLAGFSEFDDATKQEVICLLAVINYYLVESFNRWADKGLLRTTLWQGILVYLSFFGDFMFDKKNISEDFIQDLISFISSNTLSLEKAKKPEMQESKQLCHSCGMILYNLEDYPIGDTSSKYCKYCANEDGTLRPFAEVLNTMTTFFTKTQILSPDAARRAAFAVLSKNPAWKDNKKEKQ